MTEWHARYGGRGVMVQAFTSRGAFYGRSSSVVTKVCPVGKTLTDFSDEGAKMEGIFMDREKLVLKCDVPSKVVSNRIWDVIKQCDPSYSDFEIQMSVSGGDAQPYTIKPGYTLSAVCLKFYGHASKYTQVAEANGIDADKVSVGKTIKLPVLS